MTTSHEQHFSVAEIAQAWGLSANTVRGLFAEEEGVIKIQSPRALLNRNQTRKPYTSLSISVSARDRVYARLSAGFRTGFKVGSAISTFSNRTGQFKGAGGRVK